MAKLGDDVYEWNVDQLVSWLQAEGLNDCVKTFVLKRIDGCKLLNLSDSEIKNFHVSHESKKKLLKAVEKFHKRKKEKLGRMFGDSGKVQRVVGRRPTSICNNEGASDEEGWDSEEWDSGSAGGESSSDGGGEYLEPEDDFSKPKGSYERVTAPIQTGLVAQLKQGIAQSLVRMTLPAPSQDFEEDEDIYDVPPEEEDQDLYEEPSDSSGGAVVVRPPSKSPRVNNDGEYLLTRGGDQEEQDMYEAPMEGEDISPAPPLASRQHNFIPTKVAQGNKFVSVSAINENVETYDVPDLSDDEEDSYEIPDTATEVAPPPRPPKNISKQSPAAQAIPSWPLKQTTPQAKVGRPPPQESSMPHSKPKPLSQHGTPFQPHSNTLPSQGSPVRHPKPNALPQQNRPSTLPKQLSPTHHAKPNALSSNLPPPKSPTHHSKPNSQGPPKATKWAPKSIPSQTQNFVPQPAEEKRPILVPKVSPRPKPVADPSKRRPAPPPLNEPTSPQRTSAPVPPPVNEPVRKVSGPKSGPPDSPKIISGPPEGEPPSPAAGRNFPSLTPRGGLLTQRDPPSAPAPEPPQKSTSGPPLPSGSGRSPLSCGIHEKPSLPEPSPTEPELPPRPPKHGSSAQPALPAARQGQTERKSAPLPAPPGTEKKSAPLPARPLERKSAPPPVMNSHPSMSSSREQSSGSSIESGSADEPVVSFGQNKKTTTASQRHSTAHRGLPMPPPSEAKSPLDIMKEAPWFHGPADRRRSEVNLKSTNMDGAFLVRNSTKNPNDYSLSLLYKANIRHLKLPKKDGQYVLGASGIQKFDSVIELINYYRQHEVDLVSGGKTKLTIHAQNIAR